MFRTGRAARGGRRAVTWVAEWRLSPPGNGAQRGQNARRSARSIATRRRAECRDSCRRARGRAAPLSELRPTRLRLRARAAPSPQAETAEGNTQDETQEAAPSARTSIAADHRADETRVAGVARPAGAAKPGGHRRTAQRVHRLDARAGAVAPLATREATAPSRQDQLTTTPGVAKAAGHLPGDRFAHRADAPSTR